MSIEPGAGEFLERLRQLSPRRLALLAAELQRRLTARETPDPIAVIGMACRIPGGAETPEAFWRLLAEGVDAIEPVPGERWDAEAFYDPQPATPGKTNTKWGGFVRHIDEFDAGFFGISPREAVGMDPQQRMLLEVAWEALERAGVRAEVLNGTDTGMFAGLSTSDYASLLSEQPQSAMDAYSGSGIARSVAVGRLSYVLGLRGPNLAVDTACSSSAMAIHLACQSLRQKECSLALAGGVNAMLVPQLTIMLAQAQMLSADGRCKTFAESADGFVRSEGCGIVVLRRFSDARAEGDRILGVIRGSAVNHDGRSSGLTAPNGPSQEAVMREALRQASLNPADVDYLEAHGTGTVLGDAIELGALNGVFADCGLTVGSLKTNIGHLEAAAGVASVMKVLLSLQNEQIPPHLHVEAGHENEALKQLQIPRTGKPWRRGTRPRIAGVSSFGFSGTNVHLVLGEAPVAEAIEKGSARGTELITVSAKSPRALESLCRRYTDYLREHPATLLGDFARTVNAGRSHFSHRIALLVTSIEEASGALAAAAEAGERHPAYRFLATYEAPEVAFLFTGQGSQYPGMGQALYRQSRVFRAAVDRGDEVLRGKAEYSLAALLNGEASVPSELIHDTAWTQPALFLFEYALASLWLSWGVRPSQVVGHSLGEYVAACVAGVLSFEEALTLAWQRGRLMAALPRDGAMLAVRLSDAEIAPLIAGFARVAIAAINGPRSIVLSGDAREIAQLREAFAGRGIVAQELNVSHAFHSPLMEPMLDEFERIAQGIDHHAPQVNLISNVTGRFLAPSERMNAAYWRCHVRGTVRFADGIAALMERDPAALLEIGPDPVLLGMAKSALPSGLPALPSLRRGRDLWAGLYEALRQLYLLGAPIVWEEVYRESAAQKLELPTYPFERQRYWIASAKPKAKSGEGEAQGFDPLLFTTRWQPFAAEGSTTTPQELVRAAEKEFLNGVSVSAQYAEFLPQMNRLCSLYILDALRRLGVQVSPEQPLPLEALVERFPSHRRLLGRMLSILREDGIVEETADGPFFRSIPAERAEAEQARLLAGWSSFSAELGFLAQASRMHEVLTGAASSLEVLFPGGSLQLAERVYQDAPAAQAFHRAVAAAVRSAVQGYPDGQRVRVLEVGAGTGSTTAYVVPALANLSVDYRFTDISPAFLEKARAKFSSFPFVRYATLDLESQSQPAAAEHADVVLAANVLHATADLRQTLKGLRQTLAPGGILILVEGTAPQRFGDLTVGMTGGWWRFTDTDLRPDYPLISREQWLGLLREAGFEADALGNSSDCGPLAGQQTVLVARLLQTEPSVPRRPARLRLKSGQADNKARIQAYLEGTNLSPRIVLESAHLPGEVPQAAFDFASEMLATLQQVAAGVTGAADVWLMLRDTPEGSGDILASMAEGMAKTAQIEHPHLRVRCVQLAEEALPEDFSRLERLFAEETAELSFRLRDGEISVARLVRPEEAGVVSWRPAHFRADAAYLIAGGLGGLGLRTAEWMVDKGAKLILLAGRRSPSPGAQSTLDRLRARGARIIALTGDISQADDVKRIFAEIEGSGMPLRGVIQAAGTVEDATLLQQSQAHLDTVFAAKVRGSWLLHEATRAKDLDFFVLYGSAASTLGSAGQANHAAANGFLDGLADLRRQMGLPATAIAWGAWSEIGAATRITDTGRGSRLGLGSFSPKKGIEILEQAMGSGLSRLSALPVDWPRYLTQLQGSWPFFERQRITRGVAVEVKQFSGPDLKTILAEVPSERRVEAISAAIRSRVALVLRLESPATLRDEQPFPELGLDSLMAVELKNDLQATSGVSLPANFFFEFPTVRQAAAYLNAKMAAGETAGRRLPEPAEYEEVEL